MKEVKTMEPMIIKFASTPEERARMDAKMREYFSWCRHMNYDAANEENWNNFSESYNNRWYITDIEVVIRRAHMYAVYQHNT